MRILLIGGGGREHALAWKMAESPLCDKLFIAPGNPGTALHGENVPLDIHDKASIGDFALSNDINMVVVGPEVPLVQGLGDHFAADSKLRDILFVGPQAAGARLEGSKAFAKAFMKQHHIPTAGYQTFTCESLQEAYRFVESLSPPYVIKADGLAAGKGVIICSTPEEAKDTIEEMLCNNRFGDASKTVVIEEFLEGREMSVFVITDGNSWKLLPAAKDYKRIGEKDTGANTGGMGAVSPVPFAGPQLMKRIEQRIIQPTISGLKAENIPFTGFIFFGLMVVEDDPYVIEYNVRLGDPEAEVVLPRISSDIVAMMEAAACGRLQDYNVRIINDYAICVVITSGGYPDEFEKGFTVTGLDQVSGSHLFFAGLKHDDNRLVTGGGRVIAITSTGADFHQAREKTYKNARIVDFKGKYYRRDIGKDLIPYI
ncbi:MAG: phosphoribosylamine--glycine ligase [Bacteroidia bacterium]|nr:MAG: phosphoribosylamine--glycine ligase [Bacteroidia bacterium]